MIGGVQSRLRQLDIYKKLPSDITEPTTAGALISIISTIVIFVLLITELQAYIEVDNSSEMFVDINRGGERIRVNLDVVFHRMPCDILSLDAQDIMGTHIMNIEGHLIKKRVKDGVELAEEFRQNHDDQNHLNVDYNRIQQAFREKEGCRLDGYIMVNKVPGNFHISYHGYAQIIHQVFHMAQITTLDLSHTINHISFGEEDDLAQIKKKFNQGVLNPLDGTSKRKPDNNPNQGYTYNYYISVVPTTYIDASGNEYYVHQFTANQNEEQHQQPAVFFRYDLSPVTVKFSQYRESFLHFLVQICAILGGVFTIASIVDGMVHKSAVILLKKHRENKLI